MVLPAPDGAENMISLPCIKSSKIQVPGFRFPALEGRQIQSFKFKVPDDRHREALVLLDIFIKEHSTILSNKRGRGRKFTCKKYSKFLKDFHEIKDKAKKDKYK